MDWLPKILPIVLPLEGALIFAFFWALFITSLFEKEIRPALLSLLISLTIPLPFLLPLFANIDYASWIHQVISSLPLFAILVLFLPFRGKQEYIRQEPVSRYDERDTMFSRRTLVPGTERYDEYYARRPGNKPPDNNFRRKPGLLKSGTKYYDPILFAAANSMFDKVVEELHPRVEGKPFGGKSEAYVEASALKTENPEQISNVLLTMVKDWGAYSASVFG